MKKRKCWIDGKTGTTYIGKTNNGLLFTAEAAEHEIKECETAYKETGKPVHAWIAINLCGAIGQQFPVWIHNYLTQVSADVLECTKNVEMGKALRFEGRDIQKVHTVDAENTIAIFLKKKRDEGWSRMEVIEETMDKFNKSEKGVEKILTAYKIRFSPP